MGEREAIETIVGLLRIIRRPEFGACVTLDELGLVERAEEMVFLSDESCKWCGGKGTVTDGATCPECSGKCLVD